MSALVLPDTAARARQHGPCRLAPSALRNIDPILAQVEAHAPKTGRALEIASGSGQHVVRFAGVRPYVSWQPTDLSSANLAAIEGWRAASGAANILPPVTLDAGAAGWGTRLGPFDLIVLANLLHLIPDQAADTLLGELGPALAPGGTALIYGPFLRDGQPTSPGDRRFHESLRAQDSRLGYKDADHVAACIAAGGPEVAARIEMPANNLMFIARAPRQTP
ncbi:DUF938 domain-containing protein [Acidimangrovimonas sediminis]|uniref:DUF938 domain-containing protein n=1 Tax=Acidimangrovimonas sediminis TaxID=2056283 RepID=UPI000C7FC206|nr:DUF938 domain-containing protein [Acidimangrovimonas sediminis]